jgi:hypothetical protein
MVEITPEVRVPDRGHPFGKRNGVPGELVVRLRPTRIVAELDMTG